MKNSVLLLVALMCASIMFQSCSDNDISNGDSFFQAQIDGVDYEVSGDFFAYAAGFNFSTNIYGVLDIDATSNQSMYIQLPPLFTEGTHSFSDEVFAYYTVGDRTWSSKIGSGTGSITIETYDGVNISGTFQFTAYDFNDTNSGITVTNGMFNVIKR